MNKCFNLKVLKNTIFCIVVSILIIFMSISFANNLGVSKYKLYDVLTGSMSPTIKPGDFIVVKEIDANKVENGDIITFKSNNSKNLTTHRVVDVINDDGNISFQTKGDANDVLDPMLIDSNLLVGKVIFNIPYIGRIMSLVFKFKGIIITFIIVYLCFEVFRKQLKQ
ncbi:TPA: signal peptidase I [Clostridium perfringens]|uniref:signal peptidase I n=1 Tax=Clostridium perfringens TaxID=1502 RepID=UPI000F525D80|nr:signal peptidase I [Clostridium perfringens]EHA1006054.1 signal peptidase I [Clostridium perfringens]EHA1009036.1 signal peptidase I [Clostridium perfringens]EHA1021464.1 signal peptidase I [Clostridium perfringens]EHR1328894.1 signal peptidase I [Clostridium perfringens]EHR1332027.1 signal peptidase I [Clostridium perfringens]